MYSSKPVIFVVISFLVVALIYAPSSTFSIPNRAGQQGSCTPIGGMGGTGGALMNCCWFENVPPGTGYEGGNKEMYCSECEDGGTRGMVNCSEPELQFFEGRRPGLAVLPEGGVLEEPPTPPPGPAAPLQDGGVLQQTPGQGAAPPGTTAAPAPKPEVACGPPPMPACGPNSPPPPPPPPPTNHVVRGPQVEEAELPPATEGTQSSTLEEEQPVPVCQEGLEFNEDLGFCVPTECPEGQELNEESGICVLEEQPAAAEEPEEQQQQTEEEQPSEESGSEEDNSNN
jgi:hypothetical protein